MIIYNVMYKNSIIAAMINRMDAENFLESKIQLEFRAKWEARKKAFYLYNSNNTDYLSEEQEANERAQLYEQLKADFVIDTSNTDIEPISAMQETINELRELSSKILNKQLMDIFNPS